MGHEKSFNFFYYKVPLEPVESQNHKAQTDRGDAAYVVFRGN